VTLLKNANKCHLETTPEIPELFVPFVLFATIHDFFVFACFVRAFRPKQFAEIAYEFFGYSRFGSQRFFFFLATLPHPLQTNFPSRTSSL